ncbi:MAG: Flp family type IVb pilin [Candidatus Eisenbacteria bacterium]
MQWIARFRDDESGQDLIEYALLAAFVAVVTVASLKVMGTKVAAFYETLNNQF